MTQARYFAVVLLLFLLPLVQTPDCETALQQLDATPLQSSTDANDQAARNFEEVTAASEADKQAQAAQLKEDIESMDNLIRQFPSWETLRFRKAAMLVAAGKTKEATESLAQAKSNPNGDARYFSEAYIHALDVSLSTTTSGTPEYARLKKAWCQETLYANQILRGHYDVRGC